jgi:OOP family OmpA-OmpF porin
VKKHAAAVLLSLLVTTAYAQERVTGFYVGGSVGGSSVELEDADSREDFKGNDTGFRLTAGYRFLKWVAVEGGYIDFGTTDDDIVGVPVEAKFKAPYLTGVGLLPLGKFDLFAKGGIAAWDGSLQSHSTRFEEDNVDPLVGIGAQFRTGRIAIRFDVDALLLGFDDDNDDEADGDDWAYLTSIGLTLRF